jgi:superoxide dismutase, Cu-Zn family
MKVARSIAVILAFSASTAYAAELSIPMNLVDAANNSSEIGTIRIVETAYGLAFYPDLKDLAPGLHGFHVHEHPSCAAAPNKDGVAVAALAAGGHYDPFDSKKHGEPWGDGHFGDLPALYVDHHGHAVYPVLAPRIKTLAEIKQRSLMIHEGGDNHADHPAPLGGGGPRIACGVID